MQWKVREVKVSATSTRRFASLDGKQWFETFSWEDVLAQGFCPTDMAGKMKEGEVSNETV